MISTGMISGANNFGAPGGKKYSVKKCDPFSRIATVVTNDDHHDRQRRRSPRYGWYR